MKTSERDNESFLVKVKKALMIPSVSRRTNFNLCKDLFWL